jgi:hypothetical protein
MDAMQPQKETLPLVREVPEPLALATRRAREAGYVK